jgi:hypothetical protein
MMGEFVEFERAVLHGKAFAGLTCAKAQAKAEAIRQARASGIGERRMPWGCGSGVEPSASSRRKHALSLANRVKLPARAGSDATQFSERMFRPKPAVL